MQTLNSLFRSTFEKIIAEEIERHKDLLANGFSVPDMSAYNRVVGKIEGLKKALEYCEETQTIIDQK